MTTLEIGETLIDNSLRAVKTFAEAQEQGDKYARMVLDQGRQVREESQKMAQSWAEVARDNNKQVQQLVHNTVRLSLDGYRAAQQQTIDELTKQVERLTKQVEALLVKVPA